MIPSLRLHRICHYGHTVTIGKTTPLEMQRESHQEPPGACWERGVATSRTPKGGTGGPPGGSRVLPGGVARGVAPARRVSVVFAFANLCFITLSGQPA